MSGRGGGGPAENRPGGPCRGLEVEELESQSLTCCLLPVERPLEELAFHVLSVQAPASRGVLVPGSGPEEFEAWSKLELTGVSAFGSHSWKDTHGPSSGRVNTGSILDGDQHATRGLAQIPRFGPSHHTSDVWCDINGGSGSSIRQCWVSQPNDKLVVHSTSIG